METKIERRAELPVPARIVWEAVSEPDQLSEWFGAEVELDARPGGCGEFRFPDGAVKRAVVVESEPERHLVIEWEDGGRIDLGIEERGDTGEESTLVIVETAPVAQARFPLGRVEARLHSLALV